MPFKVVIIKATYKMNLPGMEHFYKQTGNNAKL